MIPFLIILLALQGFGIIFKLFYIIGSFVSEEANDLTAYCMYSVTFSIIFEIGFAICLAMMV